MFAILAKAKPDSKKYKRLKLGSGKGYNFSSKRIAVAARATHDKA
jgi:hypothetical protein